jgi:hypothetical protein
MEADLNALWTSRRARLALVLCTSTAAIGCGSSLPARYVIEHDLGAYQFRRYQKSLDIEIPVKDNPATGHNAAYLQRTERAVAVISAFVTVYAHAKALVSETRAGLQALAGYKLEVGKLAGQHVWLLTGNPDQKWCVWISNNHLVKIGAPTQTEFPDAVVGAYLSTYQSDLDEHGNAKADASSTGEPATSEANDTEPALPANLREGAPR